MNMKYNKLENNFKNCFSHLHVNVPVRFLTCEPNLSQKPNYKDEADMFYENPIKWFQIEYLNQQVGETVRKTKLPSHIILFDKLVPQIGNILAYYNQLNSFFHSEVHFYTIFTIFNIYVVF